MNYPVILQGKIASFAANQSRGLQDIRGLQNRTDDVLRVKELRIFINTDPTTLGLDVFNYVDIQLRIGNTPITAGFVPLAAMAWPADTSPGIEGQYPGEYLIRFSKPVLLAPKDLISVEMRHTMGSSLVARMLAVCEAVEAKSPNYTPWFAFYKPPAHTDGTGDYDDASTEADLVNPFNETMEIERFIGHLFYSNATVAFAGGAPRALFNAIRVRMEDQAATQIVRDATPFGIVFDHITKTWTVKSSLPAKGFYRVGIESKLTASIMTPASKDFQAVIGMLGYRQVR